MLGPVITENRGRWREGNTEEAPWACQSTPATRRTSMFLQGLRILVDDPTWIELPQILDPCSRLSPATMRYRSRHSEWTSFGRATSGTLVCATKIAGTGTCMINVAFDAKHGQRYKSPEPLHIHILDNIFGMR